MKHNQQDKLPTFIIIGSAKAGTTSLHSYLSVHPECAMSSLKETEFFINVASPPAYTGPNATVSNSKGVFKLEEYLSLFHVNHKTRAIGETTPGYLAHPEVATAIKQTIPNCKIIAILRDPFDRAYSHFKMLRRMGIESESSFLKALELERQRREDGWGTGFHYSRRGQYYRQLQPYFHELPSENIRCYRFEELAKSPEALCRDLFSFIGVNPDISIDLTKKLNSAPTEHPWSLKSAIRRLSEKRELRKARKFIQQEVKKDIEQLEGLLSWDLSEWRGETK